jgi:hypothetical protein
LIKLIDELEGELFLKKIANLRLRNLDKVVSGLDDEVNQPPRAESAKERLSAYTSCLLSGVFAEDFQAQVVQVELTQSDGEFPFWGLLEIGTAMVLSGDQVHSVIVRKLQGLIGKF